VSACNDFHVLCTSGADCYSVMYFTCFHQCAIFLGIIARASGLVLRDPHCLLHLHSHVARGSLSMFGDVKQSCLRWLTR
jgi:hypothetical protein